MRQALLLADLDVIKPDPGLILWTSLIFLIVYFLLSRFAFRPIQEALKKREKDIQSSLDEAKRVRQEMADIKVEHENLLKQAQAERSAILREAKEAKDAMIGEAKVKAKEEAQKIVETAKADIENLRKEALIDLKNQIGTIAVEVAEKILREKLKDDPTQEKLARALVEEMKFR